MSNPDLVISLDEAVHEVLGRLNGLQQTYVPESDRFYAVTRQINSALRAVATENEWSYYASTEEVGVAHMGERTVELRSTVRPRIINDDAVRFVNQDGVPLVWAYFLPRDAIHKTPDRSQLWVAHTKSTLEFSRPFSSREAGLLIHVPVMREPKMFRLPPRPTDPAETAVPPVPQELKDSPVDFQWPDLVILKATYFYAQSDPIMQPRVQTLEANYKDLMYSLTERDSRNTDSPFMNPFDVPIDNNIFGSSQMSHRPYGEMRAY